MAVDATGTPTTLGIPRYDVTNDAPSGLGFNAAMQEIDDLLGKTPGSDRITGIATGSVPVWNGSAWVKPSGTPNGAKFLRDDGTWATPGGLSVGYSTSLPGSPVDGQEHILVDSTTAPTYQWRFRYNASNAGANKWEFIGGAGKETYSAAVEGTSSATLVDLTTVLSFTVPRSGLYQATIHCGYTASGSANNPQHSVAFNGVGLGSGFLNYGGGNSGIPSVSVVDFITSGQVIKAMYATTGGVATNFAHRSLVVTPVAVA